MGCYGILPETNGMPIGLVPVEEDGSGARREEREDMFSFFRAEDGVKEGVVMGRADGVLWSNESMGVEPMVERIYREAAIGRMVDMWPPGGWA
jgi:hypothetical protein